MAERSTDQLHEGQSCAGRWGASFVRPGVWQHGADAAFAWAGPDMNVVGDVVGMQMHHAVAVNITTARAVAVICRATVITSLYRACWAGV